MKSLRFTLLSEGPSDRALIPLLVWALRQHSPRAFQPQWADLGRLSRPPSRKVADRLSVALELYPCDLLFVHRDGNNEGREKRVAEITGALREKAPDQPAVCVVPVRALEAWFLFDENAIRMAAGNPNGSMQLDIPTWAEFERLRKPKEQLRNLIKQATVSAQEGVEVFDGTRLSITWQSSFQTSLHCGSSQHSTLLKMTCDRSWRIDSNESDAPYVTPLGVVRGPRGPDSP